MADKKISELPAASSIVDADLIPIAQMAGTSTTKKIDYETFLSLIPKEYSAIIDNAGLTGSTSIYATLSTAYAALKKCLITNNNVTETANTTMLAADEIYLKVGQKNTWDQAATYINGSASGEKFTLELSDQSSVYSFAMTSTNIPFVGFDVTACLAIKGNGGTVQNNSLVNNSFIYCAGKTLIRDIGSFLLPNQNDCGIHSSDLSLIDNVTFVGGGQNCERAFNANGGTFNNINVTGNFKPDAILNDVSGYTTINNFTSSVTTQVTLQVSGLASNIIDTSVPNGVAFLTIDIKSLSVVSNVAAYLLNFGSEVFSCKVSNALVSGGLNFSVDNTCAGLDFVNCVSIGSTIVYGRDIKFTNFTFFGNVTIFGQNISFTQCRFVSPVVAETGATGQISSSVFESTFEGNGEFLVSTRGILSTSFSGIWADTEAGDIAWSLENNAVSFTLPTILNSATVADFIQTLDPLPAQIRPLQDLFFNIRVSNDGAVQFGLAVIKTTGVIEIYATANELLFAGTSASASGFYSTGISYKL